MPKKGLNRDLIIEAALRLVEKGGFLSNLPEKLSGYHGKRCG